MPYSDSLVQHQLNGYGTPRPRKGAWNPPTSYCPALQYRPNAHASNRPSLHSPNIYTNFDNFDRSQQQHQRDCKEEARLQNHNHRPGLYIQYADLSIRRAFVASVDPEVSWSKTLLKFQPVAETSLAHLSGESLHTIALCHNPQKVQERSAELYTQSDNENYCTARSLSAREVADSVIDNLYADMSVAMDHVWSYLESQFWSGVKPKLWLRFGKILFHSRQNRSNLAGHKPFDAEGLENALHGPKHDYSSVLKTFDTCVSHDYFRKIRTLVGGEGLRVPENKEKFIIQVADATQPRITLICMCKRSLTLNGSRLTLCKVRAEPLRHMVADVACVEQELDLRIILTTRQEFKGNKNALQKIVDKAIYDVKAEGGLSWPLGSTSSGPYTVIGAGHVMQTNFKFEGCKWKLRHANRTAINASGGRFSYEIDVSADEWADQFKVWKDLYEKETTKENCQYVDCFFKPLSTLFSWVWANCL